MMANDQDKNPTTGQESDISKAQAAQQPTGQQGQRPEAGKEDAELTGDQAATGQAQAGSSPDEGLQGDTLAQQRTDVEGSTLASQPAGQAEGGFVGSQGQQDSSSELVDEDDEEFGKDGQGAPEGK